MRRLSRTEQQTRIRAQRPGIQMLPGVSDRHVGARERPTSGAQGGRWARSGRPGQGGVDGAAPVARCGSARDADLARTRCAGWGAQPDLASRVYERRARGRAPLGTTLVRLGVGWKRTSAANQNRKRKIGRCEPFTVADWIVRTAV